MATKIRLQRGGRKSYAFYRIVIADARAPRDGRFTEKIGTYNPNTNPATVDLNFEEATAQKKFDAWKADKQNGLNKIAEAEAKAKKDAAAKELAQEKKLNEEIAKKVAEKKAAEAAAKAEAEAAEAAAEAPAEEAAAEAPAEA